MTLARDNQMKFEEYLREQPHVNPGIDLTVTVLTTGFWPSYKSFDLNLPSEMVRDIADGSYLSFHYCEEDKSHLIINTLLWSIVCFRSSAWKFLRTFMKQRQNIENLHGFIPWELATSVASLNKKPLN